jgi:hypothetical protein
MSACGEAYSHRNVRKWAEAEWQLPGFKHDAASVNGILNPALL